MNLPNMYLLEDARKPRAPEVGRSATRMNTQFHLSFYGRVPLIIAAVYFIPALYIGIIGNEWRLIFHQAAIYPLGIPIEHLTGLVSSMVLSGPIESISQTRWAIANRIVIAIYVVVGTLWYYLIGCVLVFVWRLMRRKKKIAEHAPPAGTPEDGRP